MDLAPFRARVDRAAQPAGSNVVVLGSGLANATLQLRLVPVRLFDDILMEEALRASNPVGRGRHTLGRQRGG